ncbi:MAG: hypothetical protein ACI9L6_001338 [Flavobacterium sp.]|jgi:hypothetical protein
MQLGFIKDRINEVVLILMAVMRSHHQIFAQWNPIRNLSLEINSVKSKMTKSGIDHN